MKQGVLLLFLILISFQGLPQCDQLVSQECIPKLGTFTDIGKKNIAVLLPGDTAEIGVTFFRAHQYRVVVSAQQELGKVSFRLLDDKSGAVLFDSKTYNSPKFWDFNVQATQNVTIQLIVPKVPATQVAQTGCVALLVGFKGTGN